jgi:mono/diheme cytochrome c family protein
MTRGQPLHEPHLTFDGPTGTLTVSSSELLKRSDLEKITLDDSPTYLGRKVTLLAIPAFHLFAELLKNQSIDPDATIEFECLDGFAGPISPQRLLVHRADSSVAYLAFETPDQPWPALNTSQGPATAGPFALIWKNPEASQITIEEWPFQLTGFHIKGSLKTLFPKIFPPHSPPESSTVMKGFRVFQRSCFTCHKINQQGLSDFGPDLNFPQNPTQYFTETALRSLIRNPQDLRKWKNDKMKGFATKDLSDAELSDLLAYLKAMAQPHSQPAPER